MAFTKHNALETGAQGTQNWGTLLGDNLTLQEKGSNVKAVAGLTVSAGEVGYLGSDFKFNKAIAGPTGSTSSEWIGFFTDDIPQGIEGYARHTGYISNLNWSFTPGSVYLSQSTAGAITQTAPANPFIVGFAIQTNELLIKPYREQASGGGDAGEGHITISPYLYDSVVQGTWIIAVNTSQCMNYQFYNSSGGDGDGLTHKVFLTAGTYTFGYLGSRSTNRGILDLTIDGSSAGTIDTYDAGGGYNYEDTITGISVATSGVKDVVIKVNGKNASSSGYVLVVTSSALWRTA